MFDDKNDIQSDLMMRSILEGALEEVPASVWEGVSAGLDRAARRKTVVLWWRRAAVGTAAAAAVAAGLLLNHGGNPDLVPDAGNSGFVAVAEPQEEINLPEMQQDIEVLTVQEQVAVAKASGLTAYTETVETERTIETERTVETEKAAGYTTYTAQTETDTPAADWQEPLNDDWFEEESERHRTRTSLVFSGITGSNSTRNAQGPNRFKAPTLTPAPAKTGVEDKSTNSYGIPLSFGAGVKIGLSSKWSLGTGFNYTLLNRKFFGTYTMVSDDGTVVNTIDSDIRNTQHYVGIPVNAYYSIVDKKHINLYAYAGGAVEKCISDKYEVLGTSIVHKEKAAGVQLSADLGIGVEFHIGKHLGLYIDPSLRYYFDCGQPKSIRTAQPLMMGFEMGLRVNL